jgi:hypothetical protein
MPLIVGGQVANTTTVVQTPTASAVTETSTTQGLTLLQAKIAAGGIPTQKDTFVAPSYKRPVSQSHSRMQINPNDHLVIVDGKAKKIGKQSKYLLDMLTIEE